jgi:hypothetical protein
VGHGMKKIKSVCVFKKTHAIQLHKRAFFATKKFRVRLLYDLHNFFLPPAYTPEYAAFRMLPSQREIFFLIKIYRFFYLTLSLARSFVLALAQNVKSLLVFPSKIIDFHESHTLRGDTDNEKRT